MPDRGGTPVGVRMDRQGGTRTLSGAKFCISPGRGRLSPLFLPGRKGRPERGVKLTQGHTDWKSGFQKCVQWPLAELNNLIAILPQEVTHLSLGQASPTKDSFQNLHSALKSLSIQTSPLLPTRSPPGSFSLSNWSFSVPNSHPRLCLQIIKLVGTFFFLSK